MYCFCDDSGKESDLSNRIVVMAGYLFADNQSLPVFESLWKSHLLRCNISWLHLKDFMQDQDEYAQFAGDWPRKKEILEGFINIIKITHPIGFGVALDMDAWRKVPRSIQSTEGDAQAFCFTRIMQMVTERMERAAPRDTVALVFDCDVNFAPHRFKRFQKIRSKYESAEKHLEAFTIAEPKRYLQLQAADLLAWETRKAMERNLKGLPTRPEFDHFFTQLLGIIPQYEGEEWDALKIEAFAQRLMATGEYEPDRVV